MAILKKTSLPTSRSGPAAPFNGSATGVDRRPYLVTQAHKCISLFPHESEDARLTGETRSLFRRLLALNIPRSTPSAETRPETAMQHLEPRPSLRVTSLSAIKIA